MRRVILLLFMALILLPPVSAQFFSDEVRLFPFVADGKWGFIDKAGNIAIEPVYESVSSFSAGFAVVELKNKKMTFIDPEGNYAFEPVEMRLFPISEGLARASQAGKWGYLNAKGKIVIPFQYEEASNFYNDVARVKIDRKYAFIDRRGKLLTKLYKLAYNFSEGLAIVEINGKRGYIDLFDEIAIEPAFDDSDGFSQGLAAVRIGGKYGFIDRSGQIAIKPVFESARWFADSYAAVSLDGKWGFVDRDGDFKIEPTYDAVGNFHDGLAPVLVDGLWGYINKRGRMVINPIFTRAGDFNLGLANVQKCTEVPGRVIAETCNLAYVTSAGETVWNSVP